MNKTIIVVLIFYAFFISACSSTNYYFISNNQGITSSPKPEEYKYHKASGMVYRVYYDSSSIHFEARITDKSEKMKLLSQGAYLWIDGSNKGKSKFGIHFPLKKEKTDFKAMRSGMKNQNQNIMDERLNKANREYEIVFNNKTNDIQWFSSTDNSLVLCELKPVYQDEILYHVAIPKSLLKQYADYQDSTFSVKFEINAMEMPSQGSMGQGTRGGMPSGGRGGKMHGGGMPGDMTKMMSPTVLKIKNILITD